MFMISKSEVDFWKVITVFDSRMDYFIVQWISIQKMNSIDEHPFYWFEWMWERLFLGVDVRRSHRHKGLFHATIIHDSCNIHHRLIETKRSYENYYLDEKIKIICDDDLSMSAGTA